MTKRTKLTLILAGVVLAAVAAAIGYFVFTSDGPHDYDSRLTHQASKAKPLITALKRYHDDHSVYPPHATDFLPYLATTPAPTLEPDTDDILDWHYVQREKGFGYLLSHKLVDPGWEPTLQYHRDGPQACWVYDPGDGSAERTILLEP